MSVGCVAVREGYSQFFQSYRQHDRKYLTVVPSASTGSAGAPNYGTVMGEVISDLHIPSRAGSHRYYHGSFITPASVVH